MDSEKFDARMIFDEIPLGIVFQGADGAILSANPAAQKILGLSLDQMQGRTSLDPRWRAVHEDGSDFPGQDHPAMQALRSGQVIRDVVMGVYNPQLEDYVWLNFIATPSVRRPGEAPFQVMVTFEDISARKRAEEDLAAAHRQTTAILESISDAFYALDRQSCFTYVNQKAADLWKKQPADLLGKNIWEVFPAGTSTDAYRYIQQVLNDGQPARFESYSQYLSNWVEVHVYPIEAGVSVYFHDITERKRIEKHNQQLTRLYATLSQINQAVVRAKERQELFDTVCKVAVEYGKFTMAWVGLYDAQSGQLTPVSATHALPFEKINAYQMPYQQGLSSLALQSGRIMYSGDIQGDPRMSYWYEIAGERNYHAAAAIPLYINDAVIGLFSLYSSDIDFFTSPSEQNLLEEIGLDISFGLEMLDQEVRRRQAEEEVGYLLNRLDLAVRAAHLGIWDWDIVANHLTWDEQMYRLYGLNPADFSNAYESWLQELHPEDRAYSDEISQQALRGEKEYDTEFRVVWPDGSMHWLRAFGRVIRSAEGSPIRMVGVNYDITTIKQAQAALEEVNQLLERRVAERTADLTLTNAELQRSSRSKDEFLSTMSHELRTPLNAILSLSESLQEGTYGELPSAQLGTLQTIYESGEHLLNLINDILDFSKAEAGSMDLQTETVNIRDLVDSSLRLLNPQAMKKHLRFFTAMDSNLGTLTGDPRRLKQMLLNLLTNAIKFTPENGQVGLEITRESEGETIRFTVWDNGIGIPAAQIARLFQPFVQLDSTLARQYTGSGLGLALVRRLAELHGGSVGVESEEGRGSRFWFMLPVGQVVTPGPVEPQAEESATVQAISAPKRALVIEDSVVAADHIARYLRELNTEVSIRPTGANIVETVLQLKPDVILLDILLPDISGWQVLEDLKTHPLTCGIPVIIVSVVDERSRAAMLGVAAYLVKPVSREKLKEAILKAVAPDGQANHVLIIRHDEATLPVRAPSGSGAVILYAEDNRTNLQSFMDYLKAKGFHVIPALNGYEAIQRAQEFKPDLILMDIQMPALDGLEAIRRLRATPDFAKTPIIALTALAMPGDRERCLAAGANAYLAKPVGLKRLLGEIEGLLKR